MRRYEDELTALAERIHERLPEAVIIVQVRVHIEEWTPEPARCHDNVANWIAHNPSHQAVHGWLIGDHGGWFYFNAHSVIVKEDGSLIDITPSEPPLPFLRHDGSDKEFLAIIKQTPRLKYPPIELMDVPKEV